MWPLPPLTRLDPDNPDNNPPARMTDEERARTRQAANHTLRLYPGPPGQVLFRELWAWAEFGWRLGPGGLTATLVDHILDQLETAA